VGDDAQGVAAEHDRAAAVAGVGGLDPRPQLALEALAALLLAEPAGIRMTVLTRSCSRTSAMISGTCGAPTAATSRSTFRAAGDRRRAATPSDVGHRPHHVRAVARNPAARMLPRMIRPMFIDFSET
jgi:hypothetical protein